MPVTNKIYYLLDHRRLQPPVVFTRLFEIAALRCRYTFIQKLSEIFDHSLMIEVINMAGKVTYRHIGNINNIYARQTIKVVTWLTQPWITMNLS